SHDSSREVDLDRIARFVRVFEERAAGASSRRPSVRAKKSAEAESAGAGRGLARIDDAAVSDAVTRRETVRPRRAEGNRRAAEFVGDVVSAVSIRDSRAREDAERI